MCQLEEFKEEEEEEEMEGGWKRRAALNHDSPALVLTSASNQRLLYSRDAR